MKVGGIGASFPVAFGQGQLTGIETPEWCHPFT